MKKFSFVFFVCVFFPFLFISCDFSNNQSTEAPTPKYGSLKIVMDEEPSTRTIKPADSDLTVAKYKIVGTFQGVNPYGASVETSFEEEFTTKTYTKEKLIAGSWNVTVSSLNSSNKVIGIKTMTPTITQNKDTTTEFVLEYPTVSTGSFAVNFTVPNTVNITKVMVDLTSTSDNLAVQVGQTIEPTVVHLEMTNPKDNGTSDVFTNTFTGLTSGQYNVVFTMYSESTKVGLPLMESVHIHDGMTSSFQWSWDESFFDSVSLVTMTPAAGTYSEGNALTVSLALANPDPSAQIYYTVDGSDPATSNTKQLYSSSLSITASTTIKACGVKGAVVSDTVTGTYEVQVKAPQFSVDGGTYADYQTITLTSATSEATIYYKIDSGKEIAYSKPFKLTSNAKVSAVARKTGFKDSESVIKDYVIDAQNLSPTIADPEELTVFIAIPDYWGEDIPQLVPGIGATLESNYPCKWYLDGILTASGQNKLKLGTGTNDLDIEDIGGHIITAQYVKNGRTYSANYCFIISNNGIGEKGPSVERTCSKVGTKGQGGTIFYDKGHYTDGWRYLVAYGWLERKTYDWGGKSIVATSDKIGEGKSNTSRILVTKDSGAIQACLDFCYEDYSDWYLPSYEEMRLILDNKYVSLPEKEASGSYTYETYGCWTSTYFDNKGIHVASTESALGSDVRGKYVETGDSAYRYQVEERYSTYYYTGYFGYVCPVRSY